MDQYVLAKSNSIFYKPINPEVVPTGVNNEIAKSVDIEFTLIDNY